MQSNAYIPYARENLHENRKSNILFVPFKSLKSCSCTIDCIYPEQHWNAFFLSLFPSFRSSLLLFAWKWLPITNIIYHYCIRIVYDVYGLGLGLYHSMPDSRCFKLSSKFIYPQFTNITYIMNGDECGDLFSILKN